MSNALINFHKVDGAPIGDDATLEDIADYYGEWLDELHISFVRGIGAELIPAVIGYLQSGEPGDHGPPI